MPLKPPFLLFERNQNVYNDAYGKRRRPYHQPKPKT